MLNHTTLTGRANPPYPPSPATAIEARKSHLIDILSSTVKHSSDAVAMVCELAERLSPVMVPQPAGASTAEQDAPPPACAVESLLADINANLRLIRGAVGRINSDLIV